MSKSKELSGIRNLCISSLFVCGCFSGLGQTNGWVESYAYPASVDVGGLEVTWTVPDPPKTKHGQIIYMFPGLESFENISVIAQPVLAWDGHWFIQSFSCCKNTRYSPEVTVKPGDVITGVVTIHGSTMDVTTIDVTTGKYTKLTGVPDYGIKFDLVFGGSLEVYGVRSCTDYPASKSTVFHDVKIWDTHNKRIYVPEFYWSFSTYSPVSVECGYKGITTNPNQVKLEY